ncbi:MAG: hypothetical protein JWQ69_4578 [Pseudomonas sp.]|jgi:mRNA interferase RelE/StbE|nr:hypothetical protein [Pseudomonas sp.]
MTSSQKPVEPAKTKYHLDFNASARKEWNKLDSTIRLQFAKKLKTRLEQPRVEADKLSGMPDCYKIKLRSAGYRLAYEVQDGRLIVLVVAVGKREKGDIYSAAKNRLQ